MIGDWQGCTPCVPNCKKFRAVKCIRPVGHGEQEADVIADGYCQGPKPKESEIGLCRERRESTALEVEETPEPSVDLDAGDSGPGLSRTALSSNVFPHSALSRRSEESNQDAADSDSYETVKGSSRIEENGDDVRQRRVERGTKADKRDNGLMPDADSVQIQNDQKLRKSVRKRISHDCGENNGDNKLMKGQVVVDKEDIKNLTLTIILERDDDNAVVNFPKDFQPQPPDNGTEFTLLGMDAVRYIQRIQEEARTTSELPAF